jgi:hypothetical protein
MHMLGSIIHAVPVFCGVLKHRLLGLLTQPNVNLLLVVAGGMGT